MNVKFHKNCENIGKILKLSCVRCNSFILVQGFCPLKIKITQFPGGFRLNVIIEKNPY